MFRAILFLAVLASIAPKAKPGANSTPPSVARAYPGLVTGALSSATLGDLPAGVLLDLGDSRIASEELDAVLQRSPGRVRKQLATGSIYLLEEMATKRLLLRAARDWAAKAGVDTQNRAEPDIISDYLHAQVANVSVTREEVTRYFHENPAMFDGEDLEDIRADLEKFVLKKKRQEAADAHVRSVAGAYGVVIDRAWLDEAATKALDNPVDRARASGRPTLVEFGGNDCPGCEQMKPVIEALEARYEARANVVIVHVNENPVLATRYRIRSIPQQVMFDQDGRECFRHVGVLAREELVNRLGEIGVQ